MRRKVPKVWLHLLPDSLMDATSAGTLTGVMVRKGSNQVSNEKPAKMFKTLNQRQFTLPGKRALLDASLGSCKKSGPQASQNVVT
eukprot:5415204-Amphidinium_carterae.2